MKKPRRKYTIQSLVWVEGWGRGEIVFRLSPFKFVVLVDGVKMLECDYTQLSLISRYEGENE